MDDEHSLEIYWKTLKSYFIFTFYKQLSVLSIRQNYKAWVLESKLLHWAHGLPSQGTLKYTNKYQWCKKMHINSREVSIDSVQDTIEQENRY